MASTEVYILIPGICGSIILNGDGKLDGFGTHEELLENNAIYRDVYDAQTNGGGDFDEGGDN